MLWRSQLIEFKFSHTTMSLSRTVLTKMEFLVMEEKNLWVLCLFKGELNFLAISGQINLFLLTKSLVLLH